MMTTHAHCLEHNKDKSALVASSVQPAPSMDLIQRSPVPISIDLAACAHPYTYYVLSTWAFRGVVSPDFSVNSVQVASMHIRMWFALNVHSIRIRQNRIVCEMMQCAFKTELGSNVKRAIVLYRRLTLILVLSFEVSNSERCH